MIWKAYFWILSVFVVWSAIDNNYARVWDLFDVAIWLVALVGLYGFAWHRQVFFELFWGAFFPIYAAWSLLYQYALPPVVQFESADKFTMGLVATMSFVPYIPTILALFLYAYVSPDIWHEESADHSEASAVE